MRRIHMLLHWSTIAVASFTAACNAVLGVDDVAPLPLDAAIVQTPSPDAAPDVPPDAPPDCKVNPDFNLIMSTPSTSILIRRSDGGSTMAFFLNSDVKPDILLVPLFNNFGGHGIVNAPGTYSLTAEDSTWATCGICALVLADVERSSGNSAASFLALAQGSLTLTKADSTGMAGQLQNLRLRHVNISTNATIEINDGCMVTIENVRFDMPYSQTASQLMIAPDLGVPHGAAVVGHATGLDGTP